MVDCETSSLTNINHSRRLIPDGIHRHEGMREEKPVFPLNAERQAREALVSFFYVFGMTWPGVELLFLTHCRYVDKTFIEILLE